MKFRKLIRLARVSLALYVTHMRKNVLLAVSISVSIFLFLMVSLYYDFYLATYINGTKQVQDNYIAINSNDKTVFQHIKTMFLGENCYHCAYGTAAGSLKVDEETSIPIHYNLIGLEEYCDNLYLYAGLSDDMGVDYSNIYGFEQFHLICGTGEFLNDRQVIISEEYALLLGEEVEDCLGMQITINTSTCGQLYTIIGVYEQVLSATRINRDTFATLNAGVDSIDDDTSLVFTVLIPVGGVSDESYNKYWSYLFYYTSVDYASYVGQLASIVNTDGYLGYLSYMTPDTIADTIVDARSDNILIKCALMLVVAIISGISVSGMMINSIADRKKEIGIKKALGASDGDIMFGFVFENLINAFLAIFLALALASTVFLIYAHYQRHVQLIDYTIRFYPETIGLFVCYTLSSMIGFGLLPAYRATQVNLIDTLRDE